MKGAITSSYRPLFPTKHEKFSFAALLVFTSVVAIAGGMGNSMLFFGLLLVLSLLLLTLRAGERHRRWRTFGSRTNSKRSKEI